MTFSVGERVRARVMNPGGHTRLPAYLRGREGLIERAVGIVPFADARSEGRRDATAMLYTVSFSAAEVFGADAPARTTICAELYEPYLEALI